MQKQMTNEEFFKSLSGSEWDKAEAVEAEIGALLNKGFTKDVGIKFVRTVMDVRIHVPSATVGGVFDAALSIGLSHIRDRVGVGQMRESIKRKRKLAGKRASVRGV